jgi:hypothetical protein
MNMRINFYNHLVAIHTPERINRNPITWIGVTISLRMNQEAKVTIINPIPYKTINYPRVKIVLSTKILPIPIPCSNP